VGNASGIAPLSQPNKAVPTIPQFKWCEEWPQTPWRTARVSGELANNTQGADDMNDHDEWTSYSHWGMFMTGTEHSK
jgi:hypothetical protein